MGLYTLYMSPLRQFPQLLATPLLIKMTSHSRKTPTIHVDRADVHLLEGSPVSEEFPRTVTPSPPLEGTPGTQNDDTQYQSARGSAETEVSTQSDTASSMAPRGSGSVLLSSLSSVSITDLTVVTVPLIFWLKTILSPRSFHASSRRSPRMAFARQIQTVREVSSST